MHESWIRCKILNARCTIKSPNFLTASISGHMVYDRNIWIDCSRFGSVSFFLCLTTKHVINTLGGDIIPKYTDLIYTPYNTYLKFPDCVVWRYTNGATAEEVRVNCIVLSTTLMQLRSIMSKIIRYI